MSRARAFAAVDLGAESGRVALGRLDGEQVSLEIVHRFANRPVWLNDGLHWDLLNLFDESLQGMARAAEIAPLEGIGVDAWGVDYALLDPSDRVLGLPFHYRDRRTEGMIAAAHAQGQSRGAVRAYRHSDDADQHCLPADGGSRRRGRAGRRPLGLRPRPVRPVDDRRAGQ